MRSKSSRGEREERRRDELRYLALQPCARCKLRLSSVTAGLARALQPPLSPVEGIPTPCSIVVGIRGIPISSRIKRAPLPLWGLTLPPVNSRVLSLSPYLVNHPLSVRLSIRLAICFIALSIYLSFCLNHYAHICKAFHTVFYTCFISA